MPSLRQPIRVREGASISKIAGPVNKLFPPMMIHLISSGEASGRLEEMFGSCGPSGQEREVNGTLLPHLLGILQAVW